MILLYFNIRSFKCMYFCIFLDFNLDFISFSSFSNFSALISLFFPLNCPSQMFVFYLIFIFNAVKQWIASKIKVFVYIIYVCTSDARMSQNVTAASNKVSTRQPPAPIFLSALDNRTRSSHSGFVWTWKTWKSHGILKPQFPDLESFGKICKPRKFWKSHENLFHNPLYNIIMFN